MDINLSADHEKFRDEVRVFIEENAPKDLFASSAQRAPDSEKGAKVFRAWAAKQYDAGYLGSYFPPEYGGADEYDEQKEMIYQEECARAGVPSSFGFAPQAAHAVMNFGSDEQKSFFLPKIRTSEHLWCQLFSEPGAGSDLAGLSTRAEPVGSHFLLNGQKVWNTIAHFSDYGLLLARTDSDAAKHSGLSMFALDLTLPGVEVRPLVEITGRKEFNEVFFTDVEVPANALIGMLHGGWPQARSVLAAERANIGSAIIRVEGIAHRLYRGLSELDADGQPANENSAIRLEFARLYSRIIAAKAINLSHKTKMLRDIPDMSIGPVGKISMSEALYDITEFGMRALGSAGALDPDDPDSVDEGVLIDEFMGARAWTIGGGTNEIMRNMLAERVLGLPKS